MLIKGSGRQHAAVEALGPARPRWPRGLLAGVPRAAAFGSRLSCGRNTLRPSGRFCTHTMNFGAQGSSHIRSPCVNRPDFTTSQRSLASQTSTALGRTSAYRRGCLPYFSNSRRGWHLAPLHPETPRANTARLLLPARSREHQCDAAKTSNASPWHIYPLHS